MENGESQNAEGHVLLHDAAQRSQAVRARPGAWTLIAARALTLFSSRKFFFCALAWFLFQAVWMALSTARSIAPDEGAHVATIALYAADGIGPFIHNQPESAYHLGAVSRSPSYLYHYLMSFPYRLLPADLESESVTVVLRLVNLLLPLIGLCVFHAALSRITPQSIAPNLAIWMLSNSLMFVFLAGSVSYDNMVFLSCSVVLFYWVKLFQAFTVEDLLKLLVWMLVASLTKFTFLPLGATLGALLLVRYWGRYRVVLKEVVTGLLKRPLGISVLGALLAIFLVLFVERYGVNYVRYGTYKPQCDQVLTFDQCMHSALFRRNLAFRDVKVADHIPDGEFIYKWALKMKRGVFAIIGHRATTEPPFIKKGTVLAFCVMILAAGVSIRRRDGIMLYFLVIMAVYAATLLLHNYHLYEQSGRFGLALQGRYIFPVLGIYFFVGCFYLTRLSRRFPVIQAVVVMLLVGFFSLAGLPHYLVVTGPKWHTSFTVDFNKAVKEQLTFLPYQATGARPKD